MRMFVVIRALCLALIASGVAFMSSAANGSIQYWTDWTTNVGNTTVTGTITTPTSTVGVTYSNPQGIAFLNDGVDTETDYWTQGSSGSLGRNAARSPYTSTIVDNIPTGTDMIALRFAGTQTLTFSQTIANPVFSYVSLNGNGYAFDQDFEILSFGHSSDGNDQGYWGAGTSFKQVVDLGGGVFEYRLLGTGEPHGTIRFTGAFDTVSWRSLTNEFWNGFTVGVAGTEAEIFVPEAASAAVWSMLTFLALVVGRRINGGLPQSS